MRNQFWRADTIAVAGMTLVAVLVFVTVFVHATVYTSESDMGVPASQMAAVAAASTTPGLVPMRLAIPALSINANVQHVGLSAKGNIGVPNNFTDVAWYQYSPAPGAAGTAIIDGHVDNGLSLAGVFKHLGDITAGDEIDVTTASGTLEHFQVYDIESYPYQNVPVQSLLAPKPDAELVLITCEGAWVAGHDTYDHRLVVYARLE